MLAERSRSGRLAALLCVIVCLGFLWGCGENSVKTLSPHRGEIRESLEEARANAVERTCLVTMPVSGRIGRIDLEPGEAVATGQTFAVFDLVPFRKAVEKARAACRPWRPKSW